MCKEVYITFRDLCKLPLCREGTGASMSQVVGLPNNSYKPITNTAWVHVRLCKLQKKGALDSQPQVINFTSCLPMVGGSLSGTPASSTTKAGCHDIAEILLKVALNTINQSTYM